MDVGGNDIGNLMPMDLMGLDKDILQKDLKTQQQASILDNIDISAKKKALVEMKSTSAISIVDIRPHPEDSRNTKVQK